MKKKQKKPSDSFGKIKIQFLHGIGERNNYVKSEFLRKICD
jgi:hypothetical protein